MNTLTKSKYEELVEEMKELQNINGDQEMAHNKADKLLIKTLEMAGMPEIGEEFEKIDKWYA